MDGVLDHRSVDLAVEARMEIANTVMQRVELAVPSDL